MTKVFFHSQYPPRSVSETHILFLSLSGRSNGCFAAEGVLFKKNAKQPEMDQTTQGVSAAPTVFTYCAEKQVRTIYHNNTALFVAQDVCDVLEFKARAEVPLRNLDEDEKLMRTVHAAGQKRQMWTVNESGLYHLIFISRKPEAKKFRKWVTSEVLPALHRTGTYTMPNVAAPKHDTDTNVGIMNQLASQLDLIQSLSVNFWDYTRTCEARFEALEKTGEPKVHLYTIKGWAKAQGIKSIDAQTLLKIDMMAKHYSEGRYMVSKVQDLNAYEPKPLGAAFDAILGRV